MSGVSLSAYRIMWIFVFFDLPTKTKMERKQYTLFRKFLQNDGFDMLQYSVYIRHCGSRQSADIHKKRIQQGLPPRGSVHILPITDKQFGMMACYLGARKTKRPRTPHQLEIF